MDINQKITEELGVKLWQVEAAVKLIDEGNTIPFIARYRKEASYCIIILELLFIYNIFKNPWRNHNASSYSVFTFC